MNGSSVNRLEVRAAQIQFEINRAFENRCTYAEIPLKYEKDDHYGAASCDILLHRHFRELLGDDFQQLGEAEVVAKLEEIIGGARASWRRLARIFKSIKDSGGCITSLETYNSENWYVLCWDAEK